MSNVSAQRYLDAMIIDCDTCTMRDLACGDCVVQILLSIPEPTNSEITSNQVAAIATLADKGLVPPLRFHA